MAVHQNRERYAVGHEASQARTFLPANGEADAQPIRIVLQSFQTVFRFDGKGQHGHLVAPLLQRLLQEGEFLIEHAVGSKQFDKQQLMILHYFGQGEDSSVDGVHREVV